MTPYEFASELVQAHRTSASDEVVAEIAGLDPDPFMLGQTMWVFAEMILAAHAAGAAGRAVDTVLAPSVVRWVTP